MMRHQWQKPLTTILKKEILKELSETTRTSSTNAIIRYCISDLIYLYMRSLEFRSRLHTSESSSAVIQHYYYSWIIVLSWFCFIQSQSSRSLSHQWIYSINSTFTEQISRQTHTRTLCTHAYILYIHICMKSLYL